jgi:hypothetical protein
MQNQSELSAAIEDNAELRGDSKATFPGSSHTGSFHRLSIFRLVKHPRITNNQTIASEKVHA